MRIAIDIDSTLHHYWPLLDAAAKRRFGVELPYDRQFTWAISRLREEQLRVCVADTHSDDAIANAEPYPHAVETVNGWHEEGHFIHVTSHRASTATRRRRRGWTASACSTTSSTAPTTRSRTAARSASTSSSTTAP